MVQRFGKKYRVQVKVQGVSHGRVFTNLKDAKEYEVLLKRRQDRQKVGLSAPSEEILVVDFAAAWLRKRSKGKQIAASSVAADERRLRLYWLPVIGTRPIDSLNSPELLEFLDYFQESHDLAPTTRNRIRMVLHTMLNAAFREGRIDVNPMARVAAHEENPVRTRALTRLELDRLIDAGNVIDPCCGFSIALMGWSGRRISEACGHELGDFDLRNDVAVVNRIFDTTTCKVRDGIKGHRNGLEVPIMPALKIALEKHIAALPTRAPTQPLIFDRLNEHRSTFVLRDQIGLAAASLGLDWVTPHTLRATFATLAEEAGFTREDVQRMLGHSSPLVTQKYMRRTAQPLVEKARALGFGSTSNVVRIGGSRK